MNTVTDKDVWSKIIQDDEFLKQPEATLKATRPFVEALPTILADLLDTPTTLSSLMQAKVIFLRYCLNNGFIKAAVDATPDEALGFSDRDELSEMFEDLFSMAIDMAEELTGDVSALLEENGVTEQEVMMGPKMGFNEEVLSLYQKGELTIGKVLLLQPMLIVKNTK